MPAQYYIELSGKRGKGIRTLVDKSTYIKYGHLKWHMSDSGYAIRRVNGVTIRLHRLVANTPEYFVTDHINHNRLDNRQINLRPGTQSDNMRNLTDQGKGYWFQKKNKNWVVEITGKHVGCFMTEKEAKEVVQFVRSGGIYIKPVLKRSHCKHGHSLEDAYIYSGTIFCKPCQKERTKVYLERKEKRLNASI